MNQSVLIPAAKARELALETQSKAIGLATAVLALCSEKITEAATEFGRQAVVVMHSDIKEVVPSISDALMELLLEVVRARLRAEGYDVSSGSDHIKIIFAGTTK